MIRDPLRLPSASRRTGFTDLAVAAVCVGAASITTSGAAGIAAGLLVALAAALRTHLPTAAAVVAVASTVVQIGFGQGAPMTWVGYIGLIYFFAAHPRSWVRFGSAAVLAVLCCGAGWALTAAIAEGTALGQRPDTEILLACILFLAAPMMAVWAFGYIGFQRRAAVAAVFRARQLDADRKRAVERLGVEEERNSIARDIHDVVAHSLTVVIAQAEGARYSFDSSPDSTRRALEVIAQTGRSSLTDVRTFLERLRHRNIPTDGRSYEESRDFLVTQIRAAGMTVDHTFTGEPGQMPALVSVTLYRVLAEALTNALTHGDLTRPVQVTETWSRAAVRLTVHNTVDGAPPPVTADHNGDTGTGMGLVNIAERVALVRGTVTVGEAPGGWELDARLPLDRHHADSDSATDTGEDDA